MSRWRDLEELVSEMYGAEFEIGKSCCCVSARTNHELHELVTSLGIHMSAASFHGIRHDLMVKR
jgi:hypothetical protein